MRYLDLFSGIGGFALPAQELGWECVGFSEIDKYATQIYKKHFPNHKEYGDITKINAPTLPDFDLLVGGFPCQAFSIAGKRGGFDDTRGTLFFEVAWILRDKKPKYFLLENVKGLLSHDSGRTFSTIIEALQEIGYGVSWKVLNSKNFGVPQNRERVFIFGIRGECPKEILPIREGEELLDEKWVETTPSISALTATDYKGPSKQRPNLVVPVLEETKGRPQSQRVYNPKGISPCLDTCTGGNRMPKIIEPVLTPNREKRRQRGKRFKGNGEPAFTLTAQDRHGVLVGEKIRRLTPLECERLQGFPDGWTDILSDSQRYKCLGNAVTVNVIRAIFYNLNPNL